VAVDQGSRQHVFGGVEVGAPDMQALWREVEGRLDDNLFLHIVVIVLSGKK